MRRASGGAAARASVCLLLIGLSMALTGCIAAAPDPTSITAVQRAAATKADLDLRWSQVQPGNPSFRQPNVAIIKYVNYQDEGRVLADCMHAAGYPHVSWSLASGIVDTDIKPVNRFPVEVAIYVCEAQYPSDPLELGYLSDAQEEYLYAYWSNETVPCLRSHGATLKDLPPVGQFGEGYQDVGALNPFTHLKLPVTGSEDYLLAQCPEYPGQLYARHK